jgi:hypothetical protein
MPRFMIYIDDLAPKIPLVLQDFQRRIHCGLPQVDPILIQFEKHLQQMYTYWDPLCANLIISSTLEFVSGCVLESRSDLAGMPVHRYARGWPYFLRAKTGVAPAYAYMIFPRQTHPDVSAFVQPIPDISKFIEFTNDVLSYGALLLRPGTLLIIIRRFYKEEVVNETANYIHNRAFTSGRQPIQVVSDVASEAQQLAMQVSITLEGCDKALDAWETFRVGYVYVLFNPR